MAERTIPQRRLGHGPGVSELCLGTMMFGDRTDAGEAADIVARFAEAGGNFIDTADSYAGCESERITGRLIEGERERWTLATKVGNPLKDHPGSGGLSARWIAEGLKGSLDRLRTDVIDIYWLHVDDEETPLDETVGALGQAMADGHVRAWGFSNFRGWKIAEMVRIADRLGVDRPLAGQPYYHALYRLAEIDYLPACRHFGLGVVPYSPLARGVLTGKYADGIPEGSRAGRGDKRIAETEMRPELLEAARTVAAHAEATGRSSSGLALGWVLANKLVSSVLVGPRTLGQLEDYLAAAQTQVGPDDEQFMDGIVPAGSVVGHWSDPRYPFRGRVTSEAG